MFFLLIANFILLLIRIIFNATSVQTMNKEKMKYIPADEVPYRKQTKWDKIFASIPKGQALVIEEPDVDVSIETIRVLLLRRQKRGEFKNLKLISREINGKQTAYIVNTDKE
jgi:hypothetical protein